MPHYTVLTVSMEKKLHGEPMRMLHCEIGTPTRVEIVHHNVNCAILFSVPIESAFKVSRENERLKGGTVS